MARLKKMFPVLDTQKQGKGKKTDRINSVFLSLCTKYGLPDPDRWGLRLEKGDCSSEIISLILKKGKEELRIPLFPWRQERRFLELGRLIESKTVENVVLCRFSCFIGNRKGSLESILYRELDLAEWLNGSTITSLYGTRGGTQFMNLLLHLSCGAICSMEVGTMMPDKLSDREMDRHELIGQRGVASDRVVDTQIPQESIYLFTQKGEKHYTDTDSELFGLEDKILYSIRDAFSFVRQYGSGSNKDLVQAIRIRQRRHNHLISLIDLATRSADLEKPFKVKGTKK